LLFFEGARIFATKKEGGPRRPDGGGTRTVAGLFHNGRLEQPGKKERGRDRGAQKESPSISIKKGHRGTRVKRGGKREEEVGKGKRDFLFEKKKSEKVVVDCDKGEGNRGVFLCFRGKEKK